MSNKITVNGITSYEIISENDYKQVEVFGLLPTDRDPSAWLRMVARIFAAYKGVDVTKSISAYIDGFHILNDENNIVNYDSAYYTFIIEKGACFIDNQFIGFKDNVMVKFPKLKFLPGHEYWLVLRYNWLMQANYSVAKFEAIPPDLFVEGEMLKIRGFKIGTDGSFHLLPDDLDDQFAQNFKKIFDLASKKIQDTIENLKYHYLVYDPEEHKIDISCKSGDFVYLDYVSGTYKPARSCTKRLDKAVGIYLKDINNNKDYIIYNGFVNFNDSRWYIDPDRIYLKNLEPGASYYLADNCIIRDTVNPFYDDALQLQNVDPGRISTKFYPGLVRVGYAVSNTEMFIQLDYTSEINVQNILELFGDKERFDIRYQDFYKYYSLLADQQFLLEYLNKTNDTITNITNELSEIDEKINNNKRTFLNQYNDFNLKKDALNQNIDNFDLTSDLQKGFLRYSYNIENNMTKNLFNSKLFYLFSNLMNFYFQKLNQIKNKIFDDDNSIIKKFKYSNYDNSGETTNPDGNFLKIALSNIEANMNTFLHGTSLAINLISDNNLIIDTEYDIENVKSLITQYNDYINKRISTSVFINFLKDFYNDLDDSGFFKKIEVNLINSLKNYNKDFNPVIFYLFDISNVANFSYQIFLDKIIHTEYKLTNSINTEVIFNEDANKNDTTSNLIENVDFIENQTTGSFSGSYSAVQNIKNYMDYQAYSDLLDAFEKFIYIGLIIESLLNSLMSFITNFKNNLEKYKNTEPLIDSIESFESNINTKFQNSFEKFNEFIQSFENLSIESINLSDLYKQKEFIEKFLNELNDLYKSKNESLIEINNEIENYKQALGKDLDFNIPTKSIFMISNYQRIIYNYTYITNRLKIKYNELKIINDRIEIAHRARTEVQSKIPVNKDLDEQLKYIINSYEALKNEVENEIKSLTEEYNKIRTEYLGLNPIEVGDPNFDDGGYAIFDLDCLDNVE